jgi:hypothetical protein
VLVELAGDVGAAVVEERLEGEGGREGGREAGRERGREGAAEIRERERDIGPRWREGPWKVGDRRRIGAGLRGRTKLRA